MGLLFTPRKVRNIWQERGEKIGESRAKAEAARAKAESADWYTRMKQAEREGKDFNEPPPFLDDNDADQK